MANSGEFAYNPQDVNCEANINEFIFNTLLSRQSFIQLVVVNKVKDGLLLDVTPLVSGFSATETITPNTPVYNVPVWRLQRGASAVIMDPVAGDIGIMLCCDRDITNVKEAKKESLPASMRTHSKSDGVYLGGLLNSDPVQYVKFASDGIDIVSPMVVNIDAPIASFSGDVSVAGNISAAGEVSAKGISLSTHVHSGVESGNSNTQGPK